MKKKIKNQKVMKFSELENKVAALWTRVSTERQEENNCSLETQERICREYAANHGITIKKHSWRCTGNGDFVACRDYMVR